MTKQNLFLIIGFAVMLLIGTAMLLIYNNNVYDNPKDKLFNDTVELTDEVVLSTVPHMSGNSVNFEMISKRWVARNQKGQKIGVVYQGVIKNDFNLTGSGLDYGYMEILIGVSEDKKVSVEPVHIYQSDWVIVGIQKYLLDFYTNVNYLDVLNIPSFDADIVAGVTNNPATVSTDAIKLMVLNVLYREFPELLAIDPLEEVYGSGYFMETVEDFETTEHIVRKRTVLRAGEVVGYVYDLQGEGEYFNETDSIVLEVYFNLDNEIVEILLPEDKYNHSKGTFRNRMVEYVKVFKGLTLQELTAAVDGPEGDDIATGSSNSKALVDLLLKAFVNEVPDAGVILNALELIYGEGAVLEDHATFTPTAHVIKQRNVKIGDNVVGYVYDLKGEGFYFNNTDSIVVEVYFDQDDEIVKILLPEESYNHSKTPPTYRPRVVDYVEVYIGYTLDDLTAAVDSDLGNDIAAGTSNTRGLIDILLKALVSEVG